MASIVITHDQFLRVSEGLKKENLIKSIQEKWEKCSKQQRIFVLEFLKAAHPEKKNKIQEIIKKEKSNNLNEKWYNTVLDIVGWLDPTGIADALNGVIYLTQGEYLFGFLSFVGAIPYAGDIIAKPVMYALKLGKPSARALNGVMKLSKAGKTTEAAAELAKLTSQGGIVGTFVKGIGKIGKQLEDLIKAMPGGALKGFKNTLLEWIQLFKNHAKSGIVPRQVGANLAKRMSRMSAADQVKNLEAFKKALVADRSFVGKFMGPRGPFSSYRTPGKLFSWKTFWGGMPQLMGRNRSVRALMRKTKWYLGLLDFLGIANFVGPDELQQQMGNAKFEEEISNYNQTQQAQQYAQDDFGSGTLPDDAAQSQPTAQQSQQQQSRSGGLDPLSWLLNSSLKMA
jgi:hypothetical protein